MSSLKLMNVRKAYGKTPVLDDISLSIEAREFIAFLGPSGSGKSTLLRIIAGLESADTGEVWLDGKRIDELPPGQRNIALVFQQYALYPHMSVYDNMAFGLRNIKVPKGEIAERIRQAAITLEIEQLLERKPGQLSGGQRQRVAIGRAIVKAPRLFLLDEPLSNLDAALRNRTRVELAQLRHRVDAGVIMVTHDQVEAMTLADRIVVMHDRVIQQVGTPMAIYERPANRFVARFVGSPQMSLLSVTLEPVTGPFATVRLSDGAIVSTKVPVEPLRSSKSLELGLRPEWINVVAPETGTLQAKAMIVERLGDRTLVYAKLPDGSEIIALAVSKTPLQMGEPIGLTIDASRAHLFNDEGIAYHPDTLS
jgi:multiple sugar transport system ATP-binding protein